MKKIQDAIALVCPGKTVVANGDMRTLLLDKEAFTSATIAFVETHGLRLALLFASDDRKSDHTYGLHALLTDDSPNSAWLLINTTLHEDDPSYPSLTTHLVSAYWYERYLHDMFGIIPKGHPDLRRLVHHENVPEGTFPLRKDFVWNTKLPVADVPYPMLHVDGDGVFEVPVGPIHAGIIEPGHFRFSVAGERIITLEGKLFFTHKGVEKLLERKTPTEALPLIERISGDMAAAHATAFCQAVETLAEASPTEYAQFTRALLGELERITMHIHDIANIGGMGTGFALMGSRGFAIKERMMQLSARICGNRFWRGMIVPGGVMRELYAAEYEDVISTTKLAVTDLLEVSRIALSSEAFCERLDTTGILSRDAAIAYGALGIAARGSGVTRDARVNHPYGAYRDLETKLHMRGSGDIMARFMVRCDELEESLRLVQEIIGRLSSTAKNAAGDVQTNRKLRDGFGFSVAESWRGEIAVALTMKGGVIERCVVRDPSFINWQLFGELAPGNILPDFPLCNKSLNLSYSGTDM